MKTGYELAREYTRAKAIAAIKATIVVAALLGFIVLVAVEKKVLIFAVSLIIILAVFGVILFFFSAVWTGLYDLFLEKSLERERARGLRREQIRFIEELDEEEA